ncbi:MAG: hypothetical protein P8Z37_17175 [Acidobacteriota bacterium]
MTVSRLNSFKREPFLKTARTGRNDDGIASIPLLSILLALLLGASVLMAALQERPRTSSPHGDISIPCSNCHSTEGWRPIRSSPDFDHKTTGFPISGMHRELDCVRCHFDLEFSETGDQCADCHSDIHRRQLGADCEECHSVQDWREVAGNVTGHANRFPLLGAHAALECEGCHQSAAVGQFRGLRTDCDFCHHNDYIAAASVDHEAAGFSLLCEQCHGMDGWFSGFNHGAFTGFALAGAHATLECADCHADLVFTGIPADCVDCHLEEYNATTNPDHVQSGFSQDCALCHSSVSWLGAFFDHTATQFPLTGAHTSLGCLDCHESGQFAGLPSECYACHEADYNGATDPSHTVSAFPLDCSECHTTSGWLGATFAHGAFFPIYTGAHRGEWSSCSECHTNPDNYSVFTCTTACHGRTEADSQHREVSGYVYNSVNCYDCHPDGRAEDSERD